MLALSETISYAHIFKVQDEEDIRIEEWLTIKTQTCQSRTPASIATTEFYMRAWSASLHQTPFEEGVRSFHAALTMNVNLHHS